jgi:hypothetical protein
VSLLRGKNFESVDSDRIFNGIKLGESDKIFRPCSSAIRARINAYDTSGGKKDELHRIFASLSMI